MDAAAILRHLYDDLTAWAPEGARAPKVLIAADPYDVLDRLFDGPAGWRVILHWAGDAPANPDVPEGGILDHTIEVYAARHHGLAIDKHKSVTISRPDGEPTLLELRNQLHQRIATFTFPDEDETSKHFDYLGSDAAAAPDGTPLAVYRGRYRLTAVDRHSGYRAAAE